MTTDTDGTMTRLGGFSDRELECMLHMMGYSKGMGAVYGYDAEYAVLAKELEFEIEYRQRQQIAQEREVDA